MFDSAYGNVDRYCRQILFLYLFPSMFPRLGSSVAQLSVVPVGWTHPQEVSHLDTHTAPGFIQKVGQPCVCATRREFILKACATEHFNCLC